MPKRWLPLVLAAVLLAAASGCGKYAPEPSSGPPTVTDGRDTEVPDTLLGLQESASVGGLTVTLNQVEKLTEGPGLQEGYVYLLLHLTLKNEGPDSYTLNTPHFALTSSDGSRSTYSPQATMQRSPQLRGTLLQGQELQGWLGFMARADSDAFTLTFTHPTYGTATWAFSQP